MEPYSCIIVDDEQNNRKSLRLLIEKFCPELKIVGEAWDKESIQEILRTVAAQVLFLDIQIGTSTIFDILDDEDVINHDVIMVTAYSEFALKSYDLHAIDYLLKPVNYLDLRKVVKKITASKVDKLSNVSPFKKLRKIHQEKYNDSKLSLTDLKGIHIVDVSNILYCESSGNYTTLFFVNGDNQTFTKNLKYFEEKLTSFNFFRIYKSYLINLRYVKSVSNDDGGIVYMINKKGIPISRFKKKDFLKKIENLTI